MSFTEITPTTPRINRSELAVPGSQPAFFEKAAKGAADVIFLDLEDAVAPDEKEKARKNIIAALHDVAWGEKTLSVRINGLDTHFMYRDVVDVMELGGERLDLLMIPKVGTAADVYALDMLVTQIETAKGRKKRIGFELIIETALGMQNLPEIAAASKRIESLHFGVADFAASTRARTTGIGGANPDYAILTDQRDDGTRATHWGDMWHYALARMVVVARANGLRPIDGPFGDFSDAEGYRAAGRRAAVLGCEGKWAIHPSQVALANEVFTPSEKEVTRARRILAAMAEAKREGRGAVALDGKLLDIASIRQASALVETFDAIGQKAPR
ncbi:MAG TPA: CoA ester lyase [Stellaceae bacterium]|nr:CoA ester lyase [Stellaceae bacterium]